MVTRLISASGDEIKKMSPMELKESIFKSLIICWRRISKRCNKLRVNVCFWSRYGYVEYF